MWIAGGGGRYYVFSERTAGKVKRIRANPRVRLAACDLRGKVSGGWAGGRARIVTDAPSIALAYAALRKKYGWQMRFIDLLSRLSGRYDQRVILEISLEGA